MFLEAVSVDDAIRYNEKLLKKVQNAELVDYEVFMKEKTDTIDKLNRKLDELREKTDKEE